MYDDYFPITPPIMQPVLPGDKARSDGRPTMTIPLELTGRILHVRRGRRRPRRFSPIPYGGINRRQFRDQRRVGRGADEAGDRVLTLLLNAGAQFDNLIGRKVRLKVID
ncbi:MAG: hypothetical protein JXR89_08155 [Deltaproteobacteria bacterium]|nr:hypothetical protein [Deltaproteobacteria bacterium]